MKKIIDGRLYDTDTAQNLGSWDNGLGATDFKHCSAIIPFTESQAKDWAMSKLTAEEYLDLFACDE